jgi:NADH dehydrogenase
MAYRVVTVFGGSGFIGRHVVRRLAQRGWRVRIATRYPDKALFLRTAGDVGQIVPILANIRNDASVAAAVRGADYVINLVGILAEGGKQRFPALHAEGAGRVARLSREAGASRMVQLSAIGASKSSESEYAQTKAAGEEAVLQAFPEATILRPSIVFGPEDKFFNRFASLTLISPFIPLIGGGHTKFQPVYVADVADAVMVCLTDPETGGKTFELGGPQVYSFRELMEIMLTEIRRKRWLVPMPWSLARIQASVLQLLPQPLLTRDQLKQLQADNVVSEHALTLKDLGITPTALEVIVPTYLERFRPGGRFAWRRVVE